MVFCIVLQAYLCFLSILFLFSCLISLPSSLGQGQRGYRLADSNFTGGVKAGELPTSSIKLCLLAPQPVGQYGSL